MKKQLQFKQFLINERHEYLGHRIGDILSAVQDLIDNQTSISTRQLVRHGENIVNQIRKVLHGNWPTEELQYLRKLQKVGVAIMRAIDEKDDLREIMVSVGHELENISGSLGVPANHLATPAADEGGEAPPQPAGQQQQPPQPPQPPQAPQPQQQQMPAG